MRYGTIEQIIDLLSLGRRVAYAPQLLRGKKALADYQELYKIRDQRHNVSYSIARPVRYHREKML